MSSCKHESDADVKDIYLNHHKIECQGEALLLCMLSKSELNEDWQYFYDGIEGFNFEWGYTYKLRVKVTEISNPPADGSSVEYSLLEVLKKEKALHTETFDYFTRYSSSTITKISENTYQILGEKTFNCSAPDCSSIDSLVAQESAILFEFTHQENPTEPLALSQIKCSTSLDAFDTSCL